MTQKDPLSRNRAVDLEYTLGRKDMSHMIRAVYRSGRFGGLHLGVAARFGSPEQAEFPHGQRRTADALVATLATRAGMLLMDEQDRDVTLGRIRAFLASRAETASGEFTLPMLTGVLRVRQL